MNSILSTMVNNGGKYSVDEDEDLKDMELMEKCQNCHF